MVQETVSIVVTERGSKATAAGIRGVGGAAKGAAASVKLLGGALLVLGVGVGLASVTQTIIGFEQKMAGVKAITGATEEEFKSLNKTARELGATTVFTASEAAQGLRLFAQAGFDVQQSQAALAGTLNLAIAGELGLAAAVDIAANTVRQFGLDASETTRVADVLAATATKTNTNVGLLAEGLKFVGPVARASGISLEETAAALGVMSNAGLKGTLAGTGLRKIMSRLLNPTKDVSKALDDAKVSLDSVNPRFNNLRDIVKRLKPVLADPAAAFKLFGDRGAPASLAITNLSENFEELGAAVEAAEGTSERIAGVLLDTLGGSLKLLKSAVEEAVLQFGESGFSGTLRKLVDFVTAVVNVMTGMKNELADTNPEVRKVADALKLFKTAGEEARKIGVAIQALLGGMGATELPTFAQLLKAVAQSFVIFFSSVETGIRVIASGIAAIRFGIEKLRSVFGEGTPQELAEAEANLARANEKLFQSTLRTEARLKGLIAIFKDTGDAANDAAADIEDLADTTDTPPPRPPPAVTDLPTAPPATEAEDAVKKREAALKRITTLTNSLRIARAKDIEPLNAVLEKLRQQSEELRKQGTIAGEKGKTDEGIALINARVQTIEEKKAQLAQEQVDLFIEIADLVEQLRERSPEFADQIERAAEAAVAAGGGMEKVLTQLRQLPGRATAELQREQQRQGKIGEQIGQTLASGIGKALSGVLKGEAINFGEILAETASSLLELALNKVMEKVADGLGNLIDNALSSAGGVGGAGGGGGFGGAALAAGLGVGLGLLAGALRDTTTSVANEMASNSAVQDVTATRGIIAGPTNIPIFQIGSDLKDALAVTEELLERIATAVERDGGGDGTTGTTLEQQAGEELSRSSPTLI